MALVTAVVEYAAPVCPWHTGEVPVIAPAALGKEFTVKTKLLLSPYPHAFNGFTVIVPD